MSSPLLLFLAASTAVATATINCTSDCAGLPPPLCCDCCVGTTYDLGVCNDVSHVACWPTSTSTHTPTQTSVATPTATSTGTPSQSPAVILLPIRGTALRVRPSIVGSACLYQYWAVPAGVHNATVRVWGAGGGSHSHNPGGVGAYVEGLLSTTPGEQYRIVAGKGGQGYSSMPQQVTCGGGGPSWQGAAEGGGFSSIERLSISTGAFDFVAVAGGGGGAFDQGCCWGSGDWGAPATIAGPCSAFDGYDYPARVCCGGGYCNPSLANYPLDPYYNDARGDNPGGSSYTGGLSWATALQTVSKYGQWVPNANSPYYEAGVGAGGGAGFVIIEWDGLNPSSTSTPAASVTPTLSASLSVSASASRSHSAGVTASPTATASVSPYCNPSVFRLLVDTDLVGSRVGSPTLVTSERDCQRLCCSVPGCTGYSVESIQFLHGSITAACFTIGNLTQVIPSHVMTSGVRASLYTA